MTADGPAEVLRDLPRRMVVGGVVVHLPASLIASEATRGLDLYAIARQCGVELRTVEQDEIEVAEVPR
jgi:hypothetical protein